MRQPMKARKNGQSARLLGKSSTKRLLVDRSRMNQAIFAGDSACPIETSFPGVTGEGDARAGSKAGSAGDALHRVVHIPGACTAIDLVSASASLVACIKMSSSTEPYDVLLSRLPPCELSRRCSLFFSSSNCSLSIVANPKRSGCWKDFKLVELFVVSLRSAMSSVAPSVVKDVNAESTTTESASVCCEDHVVSKDVFAEEAVTVSARWNDRAMLKEGFWNVGAALATSKFAGCLPLDVLVNLGDLP
jgi:hypothetical protein